MPVEPDRQHDALLTTPEVKRRFTETADRYGFGLAPPDPIFGQGLTTLPTLPHDRTLAAARRVELIVNTIEAHPMHTISITADHFTPVPPAWKWMLAP